MSLCKCWGSTTLHLDTKCDSRPVMSEFLELVRNQKLRTYPTNSDAEFMYTLKSKKHCYKK